jgi:hypothetical protein
MKDKKDKKKKKKPKIDCPRVMSLCKMKPENIEGYRGMFDGKDVFIYLAEIVNMPGHGIFMVHSSPNKSIGTMFSGYHIWSFVELTGDEV